MLPFIGYAFLAGILWLAGIVASYPPSAWVMRLLVCAGALVFTYCAFTQLRLSTIGEIFVFNTKDGTVRRYGRAVCLTKDITKVAVKKLSYRSEAVYLQLILQSGKRKTIDYFSSAWGIDSKTYHEAADAAKDIANYLGVPKIMEDT